MAWDPEFCERPVGLPLRAAIGPVAMAVLLALMPCAANAGVVVLKNGDRITGRILKMQNKTLEIDPEYSGTNFTIDWEDVRSISSDRPMSIKLYGTAEMPENVAFATA
jgi:hypothetical protein